MKILSIDTASDICGVSILEDNNLIISLDSVTGRTHSENLMPIINKCFKDSNLSLKDIDLIVCDKGPGSFTGIRIGIATAKAFIDSLNINCIGVNSLESLCYNTKLSNGIIVSIINCNNDNYYFSIYKKCNLQISTILPPSVGTIEEILKICSKHINLNISKNIAFIGDGIENNNTNIILDSFPSALISTPTQNILNSYSLGLVGFYKFTNNITEDLSPLYIKKPQAQLQLEEKLNKNN